MQGIDLGCGRLVFIPDTRKGQIAFDFAGSVEIDAGSPSANPELGAAVEGKEVPATLIADDARRAPCVADGGFDSWLDRAVVNDPAATPVETGALFRSYLDHFAACGFPACCRLTLCGFGQLLTRRGFAKRRGSGAGRIERIGLRLINPQPLAETYRCARSLKMDRVG